MLKFISLALIIIFVYTFFLLKSENLILRSPTSGVSNLISIPVASPGPTPGVTLQAPPETKILATNYHVFQSFNNCGPAALSMALRFYGIEVTQVELGQALRPYQIASGDNDDKSVTLQELAEKAKDYDLVSYRRPNGNIELIKNFITNNIPVITRTYLKPGDDIGHFRIIKGYNSTEFIQDDSLQGKNLSYSFESYNSLWEDFNFEYLVLVPKDKIEIAETILGEDIDESVAWGKAVKRSEEKLRKNPDHTMVRFNLSVALYETGDYKRSVEEFEKVESQLPFRTLWYQIEPILSYYELENYKRVFQITDQVLNNHNRAFSELYFLRGQIYQKQGQIDLAKAEYEKAKLYNKNLKNIPQL